MSFAKMAGMIMIVLGGLALIYRGFTYTQEEEILDIGPIEATAEQQEHVNIPVWVGVVLLGGGVVLLLAGGRRTASA